MVNEFCLEPRRGDMFVAPDPEFSQRLIIEGPGGRTKDDPKPHGHRNGETFFAPADNPMRAEWKYVSTTPKSFHNRG